MGQKKDLTASEKNTITRKLADGRTPKEIAIILNRNVRTIKKYISNATYERKRSDKGNVRQISRRELTNLKR